jgi:osmotically-inducible protein OsmY
MNPLLRPALHEPDIGQLAERRLRESRYYFLRQLSCEFRHGVLTLRGCVPFPQLVGCAEAIVSRIEGVDAVVNCLEVSDPAEMSGPLRRGA